jgi:hypothetical protein
LVYTTETAVYDRTGFNSSTIVTLSGKSTADVTTLVNGYIADAQDRIRLDIEYPIQIRNERHLGNGYKKDFDLGPEDDPYGFESDYDPENGLIEIFSLKTAGIKRLKPYPEDCELGTDTYTDWGESNAIVSEDSTIKIHGDHSIKAELTGSGYIQYPNGSTVSYLDKIIDPYSDLFFWARTNDKTQTFEVRLYDTDGNYAYETFTFRQNDVGQYFWLDLDTFHGAFDWENHYIQYIRFYVSGVCNFYVDNLCFADDWAFTKPLGTLHISVADNISGEAAPSENYPFYVSYSYDPFLASVPGVIAEAAEWMTGIYIIDYLRGIRYRKTSFEVFGTTLELDMDQSREALMAVRSKFEKSYWECLRNWGPGSYGMV